MQQLQVERCLPRTEYSRKQCIFDENDRLFEDIYDVRRKIDDMIERSIMILIFFKYLKTSVK